MKEKKALYQVNQLEKAICRYLIILQKCDTKINCNKKIPQTQIEIMKYIIENKGCDIYQRDLEKVLNIRRASVSGVLKTMEKNKLIERIIDENDTRIKKIILNAETEKIFEENRKKVEKLEKEVIDGISKEDLETFFNVITAMKKNINIKTSIIEEKNNNKI